MAADVLREGASLRAETVIDLRIFNETEELRLWRTEAGLQILQVRETQANTYAAIQDRYYRLLGPSRAQSLPKPSPFVRLRGPAGQHHTPPGQPVPRALRVRHYLKRDPASGLLRVSEHRFLTLVHQGSP